ncbi:MAG TPA: hypothetical protein VJJ81_00905 [Candidatus Babeliales bacterium]|nr:hypothetical protein [Candidatus Babeliales bacterium]
MKKLLLLALILCSTVEYNLKSADYSDYLVVAAAKNEGVNLMLEEAILNDDVAGVVAALRDGANANILVNYKLYSSFEEKDNAYTDRALTYVATHDTPNSVAILEKLLAKKGNPELERDTMSPSEFRELLRKHHITESQYSARKPTAIGKMLIWDQAGSLISDSFEAREQHKIRVKKLAKLLDFGAEVPSDYRGYELIAEAEALNRAEGW